MSMDQILLTFIALYIILFFGNSNWEIPIISVFNRWLRWILFSYIIASLLLQFELVSRPLEVVTTVCFLGWFLIESIYTWISIRILNRSNIPIFYRFKENTENIEWPNQPKFIELRQLLRINNFKETIAIKAEIFDSFNIKSAIYLDETKKIRLQIIFMPIKKNINTMFFILHSEIASGDHYITENIRMPFGGFYPKNWYLLKKPLIKSLSTLLKMHKKRLNASKQEIVSWKENLLEVMNNEQYILQHTNIKKGFILPSHLQHEYGQLSTEGRYRIWKEIWLMKYLGLSLKT